MSTGQELTALQASDDQKQDKENSKSYSIKFDYYDETDADAKAIAELQSKVPQPNNNDPPKKKDDPTDDEIYNKPKDNNQYNAATTIDTSGGEQKQMVAQHIELNTVKPAPVSNSNANYAPMPSMEQILGELKLNLRGQYLELDIDGETVKCKINNITPTLEVESGPNTGKRASRLSSVQATTGGTLTKREKRKEKVELLVKDSTNRWLYHNDIDPDGEENCCDACNRCSNGCVNKFIAITVIIIQIIAYITITYFLMDGIQSEQQKRSDTCYGPNCQDWSFVSDACMELTTGALISVLLIGFLWADVINAVGTCKYNMFASFFCLLELFTAMICGFLTAIYTPNSFDAISGAIGILFVHDLDERVFASMQIISRRKKTALCKKLLAVLLWIVLSFTISFAVACTHNSGSLIPDGSCKTYEYQCDSGLTNCIWQGFVCNGIRDCEDGSDEGVLAGCDYAGFLAGAVVGVDYPADNFMCLSTGTFLKNTTRCDGKLDCEDGSDEGRTSNCSEFVFRKKCGTGLTQTMATDEFHMTWSGQFKCNNGQCINAQFACDGTANDCIDGSDEYPAFDQSFTEIGMSRCPYSQLRDCKNTEALCKVNGKCINKNKICDGTPDCVDGQDEQGCEYSCSSYSIINEQTFQCSGKIADINATHIIFFKPISDPTAQNNVTFNTIPHNNDSDQLAYLVGIFTADDTGECVPYEWRCDGLRDCEDGSDEELCTIFTCDATTEFQCETSGICIHQEGLCDYVPDCADESDEVLKNCEAYGHSFPEDSAGVCDDLGYCMSDPCEYELCPGQTDQCFFSGYKCDGYCDCQPDCGDETEASGCSGGGFTPGPNASPGMLPTVSSGTRFGLGTISCGQNIVGEIFSGIRYWYTFTVPINILYVKFTTCTSFTANLDTVLYLYDAATNQITSNDDFSCAINGVASTIYFDQNGYTAYQQGTEYQIEIGGFSDNNAGAYSLNVTCSQSQMGQGGFSSTFGP